MAESYSRLLPGNIITAAGAFPLPNADFKANSRVSGSPLDRNHSAWNTIPGNMFVRKVGYAKVTAGGATSFDVTIPSTNMEQATDKHIADINGLFIPTGAVLYRIGVRVLPVTQMPGYPTSGYPGATPSASIDSGLVGTANQLLVLADALPSAAVAGVIEADGAQTSSQNTAALKFNASGRMPVPTAGLQALVQNSPYNFTAQPLTADLTLRLYSVAAAGNAAGAAVSSDYLGGVYILCEACYMVNEPVLPASELRLPPATTAGVVG